MQPNAPQRIGGGLSLQARVTIALIVAAVVPLVAFGVLLIVSGAVADDTALLRLLLLAIAIAAVLGALAAYGLAASLTTPLREIASAVERVSRGDLSATIDVAGDDGIARLAESHNRLAADLRRRTAQLGRILGTIATYRPQDGVPLVRERAESDARLAFGLIDARIELVDPATVEVEERVPADPRPVRAELRVGNERLGLLTGHAPATATWERADQDLLDLFAAVVGVAIRNAELFARVEDQNRRLQDLDAAKDDFLRGVSHNLQTPLARISAYAGQLAAEAPPDDRRPAIIVEQSNRLSRMVRQLLTVTRLESGAIRARAEVLALVPRLRRAWEALGAGDVSFTIRDDSSGWLALADGDQLDQVLWAILDNATKYGAGSPVEALVAVDEAAGSLSLTIRDHGPGIAPDDRERLFGRFERGSAGAGTDDGSGLGLYVSRALVRAMDGDLVLEPAEPGIGAAFTISLPAEPPTES